MIAIRKWDAEQVEGMDIHFVGLRAVCHIHASSIHDSKGNVEGNETNQDSFIQIRLNEWGSQLLTTARALFAPGTQSSNKRALWAEPSRHSED
jgi:hypothetical protein